MSGVDRFYHSHLSNIPFAALTNKYKKAVEEVKYPEDQWLTVWPLLVKSRSITVARNGGPRDGLATDTPLGHPSKGRE